MGVLVDTTVWSLALRRRDPDLVASRALTTLLRNGVALLPGVIRQEVLSGIADEQRFAKLRLELRNVPAFDFTLEHYERAAEIHNLCRKRGVQGSAVDFLLCAASDLDGLPIYTTDRDFQHYAKHADISLFDPPMHIDS
jgi:predicted nucleic acid-binding protein